MMRKWILAAGWFVLGIGPLLAAQTPRSAVSQQSEQGFDRMAMPNLGSDTAVTEQSPAPALVKKYGAHELQLADQAYAQRNLAWASAQAILTQLRQNDADLVALEKLATPEFKKILATHPEEAGQLLRQVHAAGKSTVLDAASHKKASDYMIIHKNPGQDVVEITIDDHAMCLDEACVVQLVLQAPPPYKTWLLSGLHILNHPAIPQKSSGIR